MRFAPRPHRGVFSKGMVKPFMRAFVAVVAVLGALIATGFLAFYFLNSPAPGIPAEGRFFPVQKGESLAGIASRLQAEGLVRSSALVKLVARLTGSDGRYQSGYFRIRRGDSTVDIHTLLVSGYQEQIKVTIPEGWSLKKIAQHLAAKGLANRAELLAAGASPELLRRFRVPARNLEGYLYPDTYYFPAGYPAEAIVEQMVYNFFDRLKAIVPEAAELSPEELHEKLIVASIVEREYRRADEAPLIASVFYQLSVQYLQVGRTSAGTDLQPGPRRPRGGLSPGQDELLLFRPEKS
jgi:UPF0755 protein